MPLTLGSTVARFEGHVGIEEADALLGWFEGRKSPAVNLSACIHLHTAVLQVLMARRPRVRALPADAEFARLLRPLLGLAPEGPGPAQNGVSP